MSTPIITLLESQMKTLIEGMGVSGGYLLNWASINKEDRALESSSYNAYACVYWSGEQCLDDDGGIHANAYHNVSTYNIDVRIPITSESTNPNFDIRPRLHYALADLKKLFGTNYHLGSTYADKILYKSSSILETGGGDRFTPYYLRTVFNVWYAQSRSDVFVTCS